LKSQLLLEVEIRRIIVCGQSGQKVSEIPISTNKPCVVAHFCNLSYAGSISRRILVQGTIERLYLTNN
jgi:hypothetical protein